MKINYSLWPVNLTFLVVGLIGVWMTTHSGWAVFWGFVASLHFTLKV